MAMIRFRRNINFHEFCREERTTGGGNSDSSPPIASSTTITISGSRSRPRDETTDTEGETSMEVAEDPEPEIITVSGCMDSLSMYGVHMCKIVEAHTVLMMSK